MSSRERKGHRGAGPHTKGGGMRGGPKRWTGTGPQPARHIPWPEIFQHHISLIEGHLKMNDMVRKHTREGTHNWDTICAMIERTKEMLAAARNQAKYFVPAYDTRDVVPLGSSSISMYPGYSPADHEYGKASADYGQRVAAARAEGVDINPDGLDYQVGQSRGKKRQTLDRMREAERDAKIAQRVARRNGKGSGSGSGSDSSPQKLTNPNGNIQDEDPMNKEDEEPTGAGVSTFFVDINPTPVNLPGMKAKLPKRSSSPPEQVEEKKPKKAKRKHIGDLPGTTDGKSLEFEDISEEVDSRLREKEEKRKRKEEKKRKRDSGGVSNEDKALGLTNAVEEEIPKKKKSKKANEDVNTKTTESKKRQGLDEADEHREGKTKKRKKNKEHLDS